MSQRSDVSSYVGAPDTFLSVMLSLQTEADIANSHYIPRMPSSISHRLRCNMSITLSPTSYLHIVDNGTDVSASQCNRRMLSTPSRRHPLLDFDLFQGHFRLRCSRHARLAAHPVDRPHQPRAIIGVKQVGAVKPPSCCPQSQLLVLSNAATRSTTQSSGRER